MFATHSHISYVRKRELKQLNFSCALHTFADLIQLIKLTHINTQHFFARREKLLFETILWLNNVWIKTCHAWSFLLQSVVLRTDGKIHTTFKFMGQRLMHNAFRIDFHTTFEYRVYFCMGIKESMTKRETLMIGSNLFPRITNLLA